MITNEPLQLLKLGLLTFTAFLGLHGEVLAPDTVQAEQDAVKSLETILQRASEQGFLNTSNDAPKFDKKPLENKYVPATAPKEESCTDSSIFDFTIYQSVRDYDDIKAVKSNINNIDGISDVTSLVKTYMSLGLGEEAIKLVEPHKTVDARALESLGRTIEGYPNETDAARLKAYAQCHANAALWAMMSEVTLSTSSLKTAPQAITQEIIQSVRALPPHLAELMAVRLGIYAAETGDFNLAQQLLIEVAPITKNGELPELNDDATLYLFALVERSKNNPLHSRVLEHLAQFDGLYRSEALQKLAEGHVSGDDATYSNFADDLQAVQQQYNGRVESRQAALQIVKDYLSNSRYIDAIDLTKQQTAREDAERDQAVADIGDTILQGLGSKGHSPRLYALNGYLYDPEFLIGYESLYALKNAAIDAAINLNLPELSDQIISDAENMLADIQKKHMYSLAQTAFKKGDHVALKQIVNTPINDLFLNSLILKSALLSANEKDGMAALAKMPDASDHLKDKVSLALQNANWILAKTALDALANKSQNEDLSGEIAIVNYAGLSARTYTDQASLLTAEDFDNFTEQLSFDITLVKDYLTNG